MLGACLFSGAWTTGSVQAEGVVSRAELGQATPFSFEQVIKEAEALAAAPFETPAQSPALDAVGDEIPMRDQARLWAETDNGYRIRGLHRNRFRQTEVAVHEVASGEARPWTYRKSAFDYRDPATARDVPPDLGFGGIEIQRSHAADDEGADQTLLRISGEGFVYQPADGAVHGVSARLLLAEQNTRQPGEQTPFFRTIWIERPANAEVPLVLYALIDAPGLTAAARLTVDPDDPDQLGVAVDLRVFLREDLSVLGMAALSSHFWYGENDRRMARDWRPEVHGSDGLAMITGTGNRLWRPLINPPYPDDSLFSDVDPGGFGLLQRDRALNSYQDTQTAYHELPDLWITALEDWGEGSVVLRESHTETADIDNVLAFWNPRPPADAGTRWRFAFRMDFGQAAQPPAEDLLEVIATRIGLAHYAGEPRDDGTLRLVIDMAPSREGETPRAMEPEALVTTSRGSVEVVDLSRVVGSNQWRLMIDLNASGRDPVDLSAQLAVDGVPVSETWLYRLHPGALTWLER
ncbi:MAG: glucan biosynthesis protein [Halothiobacillaceae bacterium]